MASRRPFSFDEPFVARAAFTHGAASYAIGETFPWLDLGLTERQVWTLWAGRQIDNVPDEEEVERATPLSSAVPALPPAPSAENMRAPLGPVMAPPPAAHQPHRKHGRRFGR